MKMFFQFISYLYLGLCADALSILVASETPKQAPLGGEVTPLLREGSVLSPVPQRSYSTVTRSYSMAASQDSFSAPSDSLKQKARYDYEALCNLALFYSKRREIIAQNNSHLNQSQLEMKLRADALAAVKGNNLSKVMQEMKKFLDQANACLEDEKLSEGTQETNNLAALRKGAADRCNNLYDLAKFYNQAGKARLLGKYSGQKEEDVEKLLQLEALKAVEEGTVLSLLDKLDQITTTAETRLIDIEKQRRSVSQLNLEQPSSPVQAPKIDNPESAATPLSGTQLPAQDSVITAETNLNVVEEHKQNLSAQPNLELSSGSAKDESPIKLASVALEATSFFSTQQPSLQNQIQGISHLDEQTPSSPARGSPVKPTLKINQENTPSHRTQSPASQQDQSPEHSAGLVCPCAVM